MFLLLDQQNLAGELGKWALPAFRLGDNESFRGFDSVPSRGGDLSTLVIRGTGIEGIGNGACSVTTFRFTAVGDFADLNEVRVVRDTRDVGLRCFSLVEPHCLKRPSRERIVS